MKKAGDKVEGGSIVPTEEAIDSKRLTNLCEEAWQSFLESTRKR